MEARATAKTLRIQPRKARLVLDLIRGKDVEEAAAILKYTPNKGGKMVGDVLHSAVANAVNNHDMDEDKLYVKECYANEGITMKRFMPRAKEALARFTREPVTLQLLWLKGIGGSHGSESQSYWHAYRNHPRLAVEMVRRR